MSPKIWSNLSQQSATLAGMDADDEPEMLRTVLARFGPGWEASIDCGEGWWPIIGRLDCDIAALAPAYQVHQVKEKYGGLRYYIGVLDDAPHEQIDNLIARAEDEASRTCELCGRSGRTRGRRGWTQTLCDAHAENRG